MSSLSKRFRLHAKNIFLFYPKCSLSKHEALEQLKQISLPSHKKFIRVSSELHENGEPYLHALIQLEGKAQITNQKIFDLVSPTRPTHFHPNIQGVKSYIKSYIKRDGDYVDWGEFQVDGRSSGCPRGVKQDVYAEALNSSSKTQALQIIKEKDPMLFILKLHSLSSKFDRIFAPPKEVFISKFNYSSFIIPDSIKSWVESNFECNSAAGPNSNKFSLRRDIDRPMSLIIEGPSRIGKTQWARSLGKHNYLQGYLDLNPIRYSNDVDYNIIDNITPSDLKVKHWKELIGAQRDWETKCKYVRKPVQIKGGIPAIVLCNPGEGWSYKDFLEKKQNSALKTWTLLHAQFEYVHSPLYQEQAQVSVFSFSPSLLSPFSFLISPFSFGLFSFGPWCCWWSCVPYHTRCWVLSFLRRSGLLDAHSMSGSGSSYAFSNGNFCECHHGRRAAIHTARTRRNAGRSFYTCPLSQTDTDNCQFFRWVDEDQQVINHPTPSREQVNGTDLNLKIEMMLKELRMLTYFVVLGFVILILMFIFCNRK